MKRVRFCLAPLQTVSFGSADSLGTSQDVDGEDGEQLTGDSEVKAVCAYVSHVTCYMLVQTFQACLRLLLTSLISLSSSVVFFLESLKSFT